MSAGANNPDRGSTGSGIYSGRNGALRAVMSGVAKSRVLYSKVPKIPASENIVVDITPPEENNKIFLKRDRINSYVWEKLEPTDDEKSLALCHGKFCCHFKVHLQEIDDLTGTSTAV